MTSITIHNIDEDLEKRLREAAAESNTSLNKTIQKALREVFGVERPARRKSDFSDLAGTWIEDEAREFEETTRNFSVIDEEMWK
jgi:plasmid stability protein